jgi:hypothetical protein
MTAHDAAPNGDLRDSIATLERERSRKRALVFASLIALLILGGLFVYLSYSSQPGTMKIDSGQRGRGQR